jgi:hypothetical protein
MVTTEAILIKGDTRREVHGLQDEKSEERETQEENSED